MLSVFLGFNDPKAKSLTCELQTLAIYAVRRTQQVSLQLYLGFFFVRLEPTEPWLPLLLDLPESLTSFLDPLDGSILPLSIFPLSLLPWSAAAFPGFELFSGLELAGLLPLGLLPLDLLSADLLLTTGLPLEGFVLADLPLAGLPFAGLLLAGLPFAGLPLAGLPLAGLPFAGLPFADFSLVGLSPAGLLAADLPEPCTLSEALAGLPIALDTWAARGLLGGLAALTSCLDAVFVGSTFSVFSVFCPEEDLADATALGATLGAGTVVGFDAGSFADSAGALRAGAFSGGVDLAGNCLAADPLDFDSLGSSMGLGLDL